MTAVLSRLPSVDARNYISRYDGKRIQLRLFKRGWILSTHDSCKTRKEDIAVLVKDPLEYETVELHRNASTQSALVRLFLA